MQSIHHSFSKSIDLEFANTLKQRVNNYFKENNLSKYANAGMVLKTVVMFSIYLLPLTLLAFFEIQNLWLFFGAWIIMGIGKAGIGTAVMHDALHGTYFKNQRLNKMMELSMRFLGADSDLWKMQHNVLHHSYTNIDGADEDIESAMVLRFSPFQPRKPIHKYQHLYAPVLYSLLTIIWIFGVDFVQAFNYFKKGLITSKEALKKHIVKIYAWKVFYITTMLVLPMAFLSVSWYITLFGFAVMHLVAGFILSIVFQPAHVMEANEFVANEHKNIERNWYVHQLSTTVNFAPRNKWLTWFVGGLNYQVEHHLFPNICHVHYAKIAEIVKQTAQEFNMPYKSVTSFRKAIWLHLKMLKALGNSDKIIPVSYS